MLHIVLFILKIIGIIIAAALGILLAGAAIILFVPICYRMKAEGKLGDEIPVRAEVSVTWMIHIMKIMYLYPADDPMRIHILGLRIRKKEKKNSREKNSRKKNSRKRNGREKNNINKKNQKDQSVGKPDQVQDETQNEAQNKAQNEAQNDTPNETQNEAQNDIPNETQNETQNDTQNQHTKNTADRAAKTDSDAAQILIEDDESAAAETEKSKWSEFITFPKSLIKKVVDFVKNIHYTIRAICDKIKQIIENMDFYVNILQGDIFKSAFAVSKRELFRVLKHIQPSKWKINMTVGTGDPAGAGQILAVYGMLYPVIGNHVNVQADFEQLKIEGDFYMKGSVTVSALLISAFIIYKDKNIRKLITILKRKDT